MTRWNRFRPRYSIDSSTVKIFERQRQLRTPGTTPGDQMGVEIGYGPALVDDRLGEAQFYVGYEGPMVAVVGGLQLRLLRLNGLEPHDRVLEIGCGALVAGKPLLRFLQAGRYVGVEPNVWLLEAAVSGDPEIRRLVREKRPLFLFVEDFDASAAGRFDYVLSHSVLSHAAEWQLPLFMAAVANVLEPDGVAVVSIRFSDEGGNLTGDSHHSEWVYPWTSSYRPETAAAAAAEAGLECEWVREYRDLVVAEAPSNFHDWIRLRLR